MSDAAVEVIGHVVSNEFKRRRGDLRLPARQPHPQGRVLRPLRRRGWAKRAGRRDCTGRGHRAPVDRCVYAHGVYAQAFGVGGLDNDDRRALHR